MEGLDDRGNDEGPIDALSAAGGRRTRPQEDLDALVGPDGLPWQLRAPPALRVEHHDACRRTRRAKQRRRAVTLAQPLLFGPFDG